MAIIVMADRVFFFPVETSFSTVAREDLWRFYTFRRWLYIWRLIRRFFPKCGKNFDKGRVVTATAVCFGIMTIHHGVATNYPIALAPGMAFNAFLPTRSVWVY